MRDEMACTLRERPIWVELVPVISIRQLIVEIQWSVCTPVVHSGQDQCRSLSRTPIRTLADMF